MMSPTKRPPPLPGKSWIGRVLRTLILVVVLVLVSFLIWRITISWRVQSQFNAIRQAGYPTSGIELEKLYYGSIPDKENNALFFLTALDKLPSTNGFKGSVPFWTESEGYQLAGPAILFSPGGSNTTAAFLNRHADVLKALRRPPPGTHSRYSFGLANQFPNARPHLVSVLDGVRLLLLSAVTAGETGTTDSASADLSAALRLGQSLGEEPLLMSQMTRVKCDLMIFDCLKRILAATKLSEPQLSGLAAQLQDSEFPDSMERSLNAERCFGISMFSPAMYRVPNSNRRAFYIVTKLSGYFDADFNYYLKVMAKEVAVAKLPLPERLDAARKLDEEVNAENSRLHLISYLMLLSYHRAHLAQAGDMAHLSIARTVIAIERYRLAHTNQLPEKLSDLTPNLLSAVPMDPFDGLPLRYKKLPKGYVIYSVGEDGVDDGGKEPPPFSNSSSTNKPAPADITFTVER